MWKVDVILKSGNAIAFIHPQITPAGVSERINKARELGGEVVFDGKTGHGDDVVIHVKPDEIAAWVATYTSTGPHVDRGKVPVFDPSGKPH